jgi:hypothetical protein
VQDVLHQRQHLGAQPTPGEARVGIVGVVPVREPLGRAGGAGGLPADPEQRPQPAPVDRAHPGDRPRPRPPPEPEQHGLGLVVQRVRQQDGAVGGRLGHGFVAGGAGGGFRAAGRADVNPPDEDRVEAERAAELGGGGDVDR